MFKNFVNYQNNRRVLLIGTAGNAWDIFEEQSVVLLQKDIMLLLRDTAVSNINYTKHNYNTLPCKYELKVKSQKTIMKVGRG